MVARQFRSLEDFIVGLRGNQRHEKVNKRE